MICYIYCKIELTRDMGVLIPIICHWVSVCCLYQNRQKIKLASMVYKLLVTL